MDDRIIVIDYGFSMMRTWHGMHCLLDLASTIQANPIYLLTITPRVLDIPESSALRWIESIFARPVSHLIFVYSVYECEIIVKSK